MAKPILSGLQVHHVLEEAKTLTKREIAAKRRISIDTVGAVLNGTYPVKPRKPAWSKAKAKIHTADSKHPTQWRKDRHATLTDRRHQALLAEVKSARQSRAVRSNWDVATEAMVKRSKVPLCLQQVRKNGIPDIDHPMAAWLLEEWLPEFLDSISDPLDTVIGFDPENEPDLEAESAGAYLDGLCLGMEDYDDETWHEAMILSGLGDPSYRRRDDSDEAIRRELEFEEETIRELQLMQAEDEAEKWDEARLIEVTLEEFKVNRHLFPAVDPADAGKTHSQVWDRHFPPQRPAPRSCFLLVEQIIAMLIEIKERRKQKSSVSSKLLGQLAAADTPALAADLLEQWLGSIKNLNSQFHAIMKRAIRDLRDPLIGPQETQERAHNFELERRYPKPTQRPSRRTEPIDDPSLRERLAEEGHSVAEIDRILGEMGSVDIVRRRLFSQPISTWHEDPDPLAEQVIEAYDRWIGGIEERRRDLGPLPPGRINRWGARGG